MRLIVAVLVLAATVHADPRLPELFSKHMVLQASANVPVWGWADPGEKIAVSIFDQRRETTADQAGRWRVSLRLTAGGPYRLTVQGKGTVAIDDVLVGEVWACSGQSNMAFELSSAATAAEDLADADYNGIRLFQVPNRSAVQPQTETQGAAWRRVTAESARGFSAVGYLFARRLHKELGVPVGMIQSTWSGTQAEVWTAREALIAKRELKPLWDAWEALGAQAHAVAAAPVPFDLEFDGFELVRADGSAEPLRPDWSFNWDESRNSRFELVPGPGAGVAVKISGSIDADEYPVLTGSFARHEQARDLSAFVGVRFRCRGGGVYRFDVMEPSVQDGDEYRIAAIEATPDWRTVTVKFADLKQAGWGVKEPLTPEAVRAIAILPQRSAQGVPLPPASLYNAMIAPIAGYGMRGAIWYQGEGNAGRAWQYRTLLPAMIGSWRKAWGKGDFPFLIVQLPNFKPRQPEPSESDWAELREAQFMTLKSAPNTGLAVTMGLGEAGNVHPHRKVEVADRLAHWALGTTYARPGEYSGPLYDSARVEGAAMRVRFTHTGGGLAISGDAALKGFALAGADRKFHWAEARIEGDEVVVSCPDVKTPAAVRYAWADNPEANLTNGTGLPASPFRSDDWPGLTTGRTQ